MGLIIIRGPLGVGKSTIAKELAKKLNGKYLSIDEILVQNKLDKIDKKIGCISEESFLKVNQLILPLIKKMIDNGKTVVVDGNFYYKNQIEDLIRNFPSESCVFDLKAPIEVCIRRDFGRISSHGKWAAIAVYNLVFKFDYGVAIETENLSPERVVKIILSKLKTNLK
jgi:tRNA uridine 5-carbamoylmethylation protein Kti12